MANPRYRFLIESHGDFPSSLKALTDAGYTVIHVENVTARIQDMKEEKS